VVDDTKRRLRNDAGKGVLMRGGVCAILSRALRRIGPGRSRSIVNVIPSFPQHAPHINSATAGSRGARLLSRDANIGIWGAAVCCASSSGGIRLFLTTLANVYKIAGRKRPVRSVAAFLA
jgi:hypothetical protein